MSAQRDWLGFLREQGQRTAEIAGTPLNTPRRLYLAGFILVVIGFVQGGPNDLFWEVVLVSGLSVICIGFLQEIWTKVKTLFASDTSHKVIGGLGGIVITLPCYIFAHQSINRITGLSPEPFVYSAILLSIGYALPVALAAGAVFLGGYSLWQTLIVVWHSMRTSIKTFAVFFSGELPKADKGQDLLHFARMFAAITLMGVCFYVVDLHDQADETLHQIRAEVIARVDYYSHSPCRNVSPHERVAFLKDGKISIATREAGQWRFRLADCNIEGG